MASHIGESVRNFGDQYHVAVFLHPIFLGKQGSLYVHQVGICWKIWGVQTPTFTCLGSLINILVFCLHVWKNISYIQNVMGNQARKKNHGRRSIKYLQCRFAKLHHGKGWLIVACWCHVAKYYWVKIGSVNGFISQEMLKISILDMSLKLNDYYKFPWSWCN